MARLIKNIMEDLQSKIILKNLQIKTLNKAKKLAYALNIIEEECGIRNVEIILDNMFFCEWIDLDMLNQTEMECLIRDLLKNNGCETDEKT